MRRWAGAAPRSTWAWTSCCSRCTGVGAAGPSRAPAGRAVCTRAYISYRLCLSAMDIIATCNLFSLDQIIKKIGIILNVKYHWQWFFPKSAPGHTHTHTHTHVFCAIKSEIWFIIYNHCRFYSHSRSVYSPHIFWWSRMVWTFQRAPLLISYCSVAFYDVLRRWYSEYCEFDVIWLSVIYQRPKLRELAICDMWQHMPYPTCTCEMFHAYCLSLFKLQSEQLGTTHYCNPANVSNSSWNITYINSNLSN